VRLVPLTKGHDACVDDADYALVMERNLPDGSVAGAWYALETTRGICYAARWVKRDGKSVTEYMHRFILGVTHPKTKVDHRNGYKLDNRRANLRLATPSQNGANAPKTLRKTTSRYRGVHWDARAKKWQAPLRIGGRKTYLGLFTDETDAARAYDTAARRHYGEFASCNFRVRLGRDGC
jgi:HNH endonuclease